MTRLQGEVGFGVLGPLEVRVAGQLVAVPGARQRALLAALLLRRGTVVVTRAPGYVLELPGDAVDVERFTALLARAREAAPPTAALALLDEGLALWRGPPYAESAETFARGEALRLHELWLAAREDRAVLLGRLGRAPEATAALQAVVAAEPWRERAVELLVTALAEAGRAGDALAAYARYREQLRDELGLDPSSKLRRLEEQVLRGELRPVQPSPAERERGALPTRVTSFVGREPELVLVRETLAVARLVTLVGPGGSARPAWHSRPQPLRSPSGGWTGPRYATRAPCRTRSPTRSTSTSSRAPRSWTASASGRGALAGSWPSTTASTSSPPSPGSPRSCSRFPPGFGCSRPAANDSASTANMSSSSGHLRCPRRTPRRCAPPPSGCSATGPARPTPTSCPAGRSSSRSAAYAAPLTASHSPSSWPPRGSAR